MNAEWVRMTGSRTATKRRVVARPRQRVGHVIPETTRSSVGRGDRSHPARQSGPWWVRSQASSGLAESAQRRSMLSVVAGEVATADRGAASALAETARDARGQRKGSLPIRPGAGCEQAADDIDL